MKSKSFDSTYLGFSEHSKFGELLPRLFKYIGYEKRLFVGTFILTLILSVLGLILPQKIAKAIDCISRINVDKTLNNLIALIASIFCLYIFQICFSYFEEILSSKFFLKISERMRGDYFKKITSVTMGYIDASKHGDLISRGSNDIETIVKLLSEILFKIITGAVLFIGCLIIMLLVSWQMTIICLCTTLATFLSSCFLSHFIRKHSSQQQILLGGMNGFLEDCLSVLKNIKLYNRQKYVCSKFLRKSDELKKASYSALCWMSVVGPINNFLGNLNFLLIAIIGGYISIFNPDSLSVATIVLFILYVREYTESLNDLSEGLSEVQIAAKAANRFFEVLDAPEENDVTYNESVCDGSIDISNLRFSYVKEKELLSGINLHIDSGQNVAIVGPSGCGKTTLIQLLLRLYDADSGQIVIGGSDIRRLPLKELRKNVLAIMQDDILFDETLKYNLSYGADEEDVLRDNGFIGLDGDFVGAINHLSRGEIQKICIIRALTTKAKIVILDESMSQVDKVTYERLFKQLRDRLPKTTFITITHQLYSLKNFDNIFFLSNGKITEQGSFNQLVTQNGDFNKMLKSEE